MPKGKSLSGSARETLRAEMKLLTPFLCLAFFALPCPGQRTPADTKMVSDDGWQLNAKWLPPCQNKPVLLFLHSQKNNLTEWKKWFPRAEKYCFGYLALDLRGHGLSTVMPDGSTSTFKSFSVSGLDNEYNKMIRDVDSALVFISSAGYSMDRIIPVGSWIGANLAVKAAAINKELPMAVAIYPSMNINDVLIVNPLRAYGKRPILLISSSKYEKKYKEFQLLNDIAKFSCGRENVFSLVEETVDGPDDFSNRSIDSVLGWTENPRIPDIVNFDPLTAISSSTVTIQESTQTVTGEKNEE